MRAAWGAFTTTSMIVGVRTTAGRMTQDAETTASLCRNVPGLGVTLDPSHFIHGHKKPASWEPILKYVCHVHLRDTKVDAFMTHFDHLIYGREGLTLSEANDMIWDHKLNCLPIIDGDGRLLGAFFADWYPRENKRGGAWMNGLITGVEDRG